MRDDSDLVIPADGGEDGPDGRVTEGRVEIGGAVFSGSAELTCRRELHGHKTSRLGKSVHSLLVNRRRKARSSE